MLKTNFTILRVERQGGIGSSMGILFLNWLDIVCDQTKSGRIARGLVMPLWIGFCLLVNLAGVALDRMDTTGRFYGNVFVVCRRREAF